MTNDVAQLIISYIKNEYFDDDQGGKIGVETKLISSGIIDSFSMVSLKSFIERTLQIRIPDHLATTEAFDSVANIMKLIDDIKSR